MNPEITKEFKIKNTLVRLFANGAASIKGPWDELDAVNNYLRHEGFIAKDAIVHGHIVTNDTSLD